MQPKCVSVVGGSEAREEVWCATAKLDVASAQQILAKARVVEVA